MQIHRQTNCLFIQYTREEIYQKLIIILFGMIATIFSTFKSMEEIILYYDSRIKIILKTDTIFPRIFLTKNNKSLH